MKDKDIWFAFWQLACFLLLIGFVMNAEPINFVGVALLWMSWYFIKKLNVNKTKLEVIFTVNIILSVLQGLRITIIFGAVIWQSVKKKEFAVHWLRN